MSVFRCGMMVLWLGCVGVVGCVSPPRQAPVRTPWTDRQIIAAVHEPADDLSTMCPADARLVIVAKDLAGWRQQVGEDPMIRQLWKTTEAMRLGVGWEGARAKLKLTEPQMQDRYLGRRFWVIEQKIRGDRGVVVASRADPEDLRRLRGAVDLVPSEQIGPFSIQMSRRADEKGQRYLYAFATRWFMMAEARHIAHLRRMITAVAEHKIHPEHGSPSLAAKPEGYKKLRGKIPADPPIMILSRNTDGSERHAASVVRHGERVSVAYAATIPSLKKMAARFEYGSGVEFGLLPTSVVSAGSINVVDRKPEGVGALDLLVYPKSIEKDVLPKIDAPMVLFMGHVRSDQIDPNPLPGREPLAVPVVGMALHMKDPTVASDLDTLVRRSHLAVNVVELDVIKTLFGFRDVEIAGVKFTVADFGQAIARRINDPKMSALLKLPASAGLTRLSFGRIGSWYLICSQEAFFKQCIEANSNRQKRLSASRSYRQFELKSHPRLIATVITRAEALRSMLDDIDRFWEDFSKEHDREIKQIQADEAKAEAEREATKTDPRPKPRRRSKAPDRDRAQSPLKWVSDAMERRRSFSMQMWLDQDQHLMGRLNIAGVPAKQP